MLKDDYKNINELANLIIELHSFHYRTLDEAKKVISVGNLEYCFDALSLQPYYHNLTEEYESMINQSINEFLESIRTPEEQKERKERESLFYYLQDDSCQYKSYEIQKTIRPDFQLIGEKTVGVEVVELTLQTYKVLQRISKENLGKGKSIKQIRKDAICKHGEKAREYRYDDSDGLKSIGTELISSHYAIGQYAKQIIEKMVKYKTIGNQFDDFLVLCDARYIVEISNEENLKEVAKLVYSNDDLNLEIRIIILWEDGEIVRTSRLQPFSNNP